MKIILAINKTLSRNQTECLDGGYYNFYIPLLELGHEVLLYDTVRGAEKSFNELVETFNPDLIFCCITGNKEVTPYEPFEEIKHITKNTKIKTFNWFCDDTWRFDDFSSKVCKHFTHCSTPEEKYLDRYKDIGYENILLGNWHCNADLRFPYNKSVDVGFCGGITQARASVFNSLISGGVNLKCFYGLSYEDIFKAYASSRIGINLTVNDNDPSKKQQMKLRIFEIVASGTFLLTENVEGLEKYFEIGKEIETFTTPQEAQEKITHYLQNEEAREKIAAAGHRRFLTDHRSSVRLTEVLEQIK